MTQTPPTLPEGMQPPTTEQLTAYALARDAQNAYLSAKEQAELDRLSVITEPLAPLPITGSTVADVKESAEASIADLATQMQAKIDAISGL